jgi:uncharacterized membrane protein YjjP (DUF1212 family)
LIPASNRPSHDLTGCDLDQALDLIATAAALLFANGQTTERVVRAVEQLGHALGRPAAAFLGWGELVLRVGSGSAAVSTVASVTPLGIDMGKVAAAMALIKRLRAGLVGPAEARAALETIGRSPPASTARFAAMAGAGAVALAIIFGAAHLLSLALIGVSAGLGGLLRRGLARVSRNPFVQPFAAALLAGLIGAVAARLQLSTPQRLIAVCPCMVLVPGPHLLNGAIDLVRARILLGAARLIYAGLIVAAICAGLLGGLALGGVTLPAAVDSHAAPFAADVVAAGVAVAAYGSFFSMPWRTLPVPVLIGMLAHTLRWALLNLNASPELGALGACLVAGCLASPASDRLGQPFAGLAFASVVSLMPGVYLFRTAGGLVALVGGGAAAAPELIHAVIADGSTAMLILLAMTTGLIVPRMIAGHFRLRAGSLPAARDRPRS